jgi:hypothetical protein
MLLPIALQQFKVLLNTSRLANKHIGWVTNAKKERKRVSMIYFLYKYAAGLTRTAVFFRLSYKK